MTKHYYSPSQDFQQLSNSVEVLSFIDEPVGVTEIIKHTTLNTKHTIDAGFSQHCVPFKYRDSDLGVRFYK